MVTREYEDRILKHQAKLELLDQIDAWLDERATLVTIQATEEGHWGKSEDYIEGVKDSLLELDRFIGYIKSGLLKQTREVYTPPRAKVIPFIPRDALYANDEDREDDDE